MQQDKETLREAVARAICNQSGSACHGSCVTKPCRSAINLHGKDADAAIATMFERLRTRTDSLEKAVAKEFGQGSQTHNVARDFADLLTAFQQENSDA